MRHGTAPLRVLVVGAEGSRDELRAEVEGAGLLARCALGSVEAAEIAAHWKPDLALIDASVDRSGLGDLIAQLRRAHPCSCALWAPLPTGDLISSASLSDADGAMVRPIDAIQLRRMAQRPTPPAAHAARAHAVELPPLVVGSSPEMQDVWRLVLLAARSPSSIVVTGETGVGKEVVARALHRFSSRRHAPFVAVSCAALPPTLLESELFGHERGAFTGATLQRKGRFELAQGGTLFLDEIGDLPLDLQVKLLRVLQERSFERVGSTETVSVDVRIIAATHRNLEDDVERGRFRADLFYRLDVLSIHVPPLRERRSDILALWQELVTEGARHDGRDVPETEPEALRALLIHDWPGNVRELHNVAQHALTVATGGSIRLVDLPRRLAAARHSPTKRNLAGLTMDEIERLAILETYEALGSVKSSAEALGRSQRTIHYRLKRYRDEVAEIDAPSGRPALLEGRVQVRPRILLADDDDDLRWALSEVLKGDGYDVVPIADGLALLDRLRDVVSAGHRDPYLVVITDLRMPGLSGIELLESARRLGWRIPIVMMSAFGDDDIRRQACELGAAAFLDKPLDLVALHGVIRSAQPD